MAHFFQKKVWWMVEWVGGWLGVKAVLRIVYSNQIFVLSQIESLNFLSKTNQREVILIIKQAETNWIKMNNSTWLAPKSQIMLNTDKSKWKIIIQIFLFVNVKYLRNPVKLTKWEKIPLFDIIWHYSIFFTFEKVLICAQNDPICVSNT